MSAPCPAWADACVDAAEGRPSAAFARHVQDCEACRTASSSLARDLEALAPAPAPVPGPWLATRVRRTVEARRQGRRSRLVVFGPMAAAVAGFALLLTVALAGREGPTPSPPAPTLAAADRADDDLDVEGLDPWDFDWDEGWGVGMDVVLAGADTADLERLAARLSPSGLPTERSPEP